MSTSGHRIRPSRAHDVRTHAQRVQARARALGLVAAWQTAQAHPVARVAVAFGALDKARQARFAQAAGQLPRRALLGQRGGLDDDAPRRLGRASALCGAAPRAWRSGLAGSHPGGRRVLGCPPSPATAPRRRPNPARPARWALAGAAGASTGGAGELGRKWRAIAGQRRWGCCREPRAASGPAAWAPARPPAAAAPPRRSGGAGHARATDRPAPRRRRHRPRRVEVGPCTAAGADLPDCVATACPFQNASFIATCAPTIAWHLRR
jgi:hypothetical protein